MPNILNYSQIAGVVNGALSQTLGESAILVAEDLSNVVDTGTQVFDNSKVDTYTKSLVNHIGKVIFVDRPYSASVPSLFMDSWEYGIVMEKVQMELPEAMDNETWELNDGEVYEQDIFYKPVVTAKFFNKRTTFEVPISITEEQVKASFSNAQQLASFVSMIFTSIETVFTISFDNLIMRTLNNMIACTVNSEYSGVELNSKSGVRAINLLYLYKQLFPESTLTATSCITDPDFIRFASYQMGMYPDRLRKASKLFNVGAKTRHTPKDRLHVVLLSEFSASANAYLQSDTYHDIYTKLPEAETVPYWQGTGTDYAFSNTSKIDVKTSENDTVTVTGVLGCMFDTFACGVTGYDRRTTTHYNAKAEFMNYYNKQDAGYFNDLDENFVVFFVA